MGARSHPTSEEGTLSEMKGAGGDTVQDDTAAVGGGKEGDNLDKYWRH